MTCAACGGSFEQRRKDHRYCSAKCRLAGFQQARELARRERDAKVRLLLKTMIDSAQEALELLKPESEQRV
jgi:heterodisulfide reductase subunit A-like polyferredoxin